MEGGAGFGTSQLFFTDSRLVLAASTISATRR